MRVNLITVRSCRHVWGYFYSACVRMRCFFVVKTTHERGAAVQHHLKKLEEIGVVEVDHHARAGDMEVTYYRDADVEVQLQMGRNDGFQGEREALAANLVDGAFRRFLAAAQQHNENELSEYGAMLSGVLHHQPDADQLPGQRRL